MDLNAKSPSSQWEWDHLPLPDTKATENKKLQPPNWSIELDRENNVWLFDTPTGSGYSGSELIPGSTSGSSKSDSISSSPTRDISKTCKFAFASSHDDSNGKIELPKEGPVEASNAPMFSCVSSEPLLNLKIGKRMKFEDVSSLVFGRKCKSNDQNLQCPPLCQVEGCGLDLSSAKHYYRKRRVCVDHSKSPMVVIDGLERRFCQQCSRFHVLFEFDGKKKSCRRRLSQHNARRRNHSRKTAKSSQSALSSSPCNGKQQMNPFAYSKTAINLSLQNIQNSEFPQIKDFPLKYAKDNIGTPSFVTMLSDDSDVHFTSKVLETKSINAGVEDFISFSDTDATEDFTCASSLLSTSPWDSYATKSVSLVHSDRTTSTAQAITHTTSQRIPLTSSEYWHSDLDQHVDSSMWVSNSDCEDSDRFQEFQCS